LPGQSSITDFFGKKKGLTEPSPYKKPLVINFQHTYAIEQITKQLRGDQVKILWMPKRHSELDAAQFISVFLLNEISRLNENEGENDLKSSCALAIDRFPNKVWKIAADLVKNFEDFYDLMGDEEEEEETAGVEIKQEKLEKVKVKAEKGEDNEV
jgi:hypothetical protein